MHAVLHIKPIGLMHSMLPAFLTALGLVACTAPVTSHGPGGTEGAGAAAAGHDADAMQPTEQAVVRIGTISIDRTACTVRVPGVVALREGWLEQAVCRQGTRDHESLVTVAMPPSSIHAALLLAGLEPGRPGRWRVSDDGTLDLVPPTGEAVSIDVEWHDAAGAGQRASLLDWIKTDGVATPTGFVFAGSVMSERGTPPYAADRSGSVIGLVTFGDEPIASMAVVPDRADVAEPALQAWTDRMPPEGTPVTVVIRRAGPRAP